MTAMHPQPTVDASTERAHENLIETKTAHVTIEPKEERRSKSYALVYFALFIGLVGVALKYFEDDIRVHLIKNGIDFLPRKYAQRDPAAKDGCANWKLGNDVGNPKAVVGELVLITGGSGFIGSTTVTMMLELGYRVRIFDNLETGNIMYVPLDHPRVEFVMGDINDRSALEKAMEGVTGVIHLAAASKVAPSLKDPKMATFNVVQNSVGTANVLELANATQIVKKVVYAASSTYYGNQDVPMRENDLFSASSPYAASKYMGELQMLTFDSLYKLPTLNLRFFMVYGPRNPRTGPYCLVTGKFVTQMLEGKDLTIEGDGLQYRDFVHVKDIARGIILGLQNPNARATSINLGAGVGYSVKDVADLVSPNQMHLPRRLNDLDGTLAETCLAKKVLNWEARYNFMEEMSKMIELSKQNKADFLMSFWTQPVIADYLVQYFSGWPDMNLDEKNEAIRKEIENNSYFLENLLARAK